MLGVILSQLVIIGLERHSKQKVVQLGNYKQIIEIYRINTTRQVILLFTIFIGKNYISTQYKDKDIPSNQVIRVSNNSQIINKLRVIQLKHFNKYIKARIVGLHQLLIINSYKSYNLLNFQLIYKEEKVITLYMPAYLLHLLQLLNVGYFLLLKHIYRDQIRGLAYNYINYITKLKFLLAFKVALNKVFIKENIYRSFRGTSLVLFNLEAVLSKLNVRLYTLSLPAAATTLQESKTLSNTNKLGY